MSNYTKSTSFASKDALLTGDPNKKIRGSDVDTELDAIGSMSATKANKISGAVSGNLIKQDANGDLVDSGISFSSLTGAVTVTLSEINALRALTGSRVLVTTAGGLVSPSSITTTLLGYLANVSSDIQTQLNAKAATTALADLSGVTDEAGARFNIGIDQTSGVIVAGDIGGLWQQIDSGTFATSTGDILSYTTIPAGYDELLLIGGGPYSANNGWPYVWKLGVGSYSTSYILDDGTNPSTIDTGYTTTSDTATKTYQVILRILQNANTGPSRFEITSFFATDPFSGISIKQGLVGQYGQIDRIALNIGSATNSGAGSWTLYGRKF